jgi:ABC-type nitrate/sulfonate/bicarbonate transport system permease component
MAVLAMLMYYAVLVVERRLLAWRGDGRTGR